MPIDITMPALSPTMEVGTLAKWVVKVGDTVKSGDILCEIETDKATMEVEAVDEGTMSELLVAEGTDEIPVGQVIARLLEEGEVAGAAPKAAAPIMAPPPTKQDGRLVSSSPAKAVEGAAPPVPAPGPRWWRWGRARRRRLCTSRCGRGFPGTASCGP